MDSKDGPDQLNGRAMTGRSTIALIGMPGAGKSTVGHWLAEHLGLPFVDTDCLIEARAGKPLQAIIADGGIEALLALEDEVLTSLPATPAVIATGGSAVYCQQGMAHLGGIARIVHLHCDLSSLEARITDFADRGIVMGPDQSLAALFAERNPLYQRYAALRIDTTDRAPALIGQEIVAALAV